MSRVQWVLLGMGGVLIALNALFPPRMRAAPASTRTDRVFLLSEDLYSTDVVRYDKEHPHPMSDGTFTVEKTSNPAVIAQDALWAQTVGLAGMTAAAMGVAGCFVRRRGPGSVGAAQA
jgi:hypothetical protein